MLQKYSHMYRGNIDKSVHCSNVKLAMGGGRKRETTNVSYNRGTMEHSHYEILSKS